MREALGHIQLGVDSPSISSTVAGRSLLALWGTKPLVEWSADGSLEMPRRALRRFLGCHASTDDLVCAVRRIQSRA